MAKDNNNKIQFRVNDQIRNYNEVRIVGEGIESKVVSLEEAKRIADRLNLDVVEINSASRPPIVRICDYGKMLYEMKKKMKKQSQPQLKEIQLKANICMHDIEIKVRQTEGFIEKGHKVKVILTLKGRELTRREENKKPFLEFLSMASDFAAIESMKDEGNKSIAILKKKK